MGGNAPIFAQRPPLNVFHFKKIYKEALSIGILKYTLTDYYFAFLVLIKLCS